MPANALMVVGVASHVGKSWMATAICRYLHRKGVRVAPFKAQNMSLNSYPCADGGEIGRSQAAQAAACGLEPVSDMNPILLKPTGPRGSQVIVNGRVWKQLSAEAFYAHYDYLLEQVTAAYHRLASEYEFIVMEGAGGAAELNLRSRDVVNLPLAVRLGAPALLVADIDRGGVFASVVGTLALLEPQERELVRAFAVNRFHGDIRFFHGGRALLEERAARPCLGVFPYASDISLDAEDSVSLDSSRPARARKREVSIAIVRLPHISNFTDFQYLPNAEYITEPMPHTPDCIILPGSKSTITDLLWLRQRGLEQWVLDCYARGTAIWGICGGYQMLGQVIQDPHGVESTVKSVLGLGLLPAETTLLAEKTTRRVEARLARGGTAFEAYEIHMGETRPGAGNPPFALVDGKPEGYRLEGVVGTYLHGALEDPEVLGSLLTDAGQRRNKPIPKLPVRKSKDGDYDRLADWFEKHADLQRFEELYLGQALKPERCFGGS